MEKIEITLSFDDEKLRALEFFLKKEKATVKGRLDETLAQLYEQTVPEPLREYLDSMAAPPPRPKRPPRSTPPKAQPPALSETQQGKDDTDHGQ